MSVDYERTDTFIESMDSGNTPFLDELEREAIAEDVPIIRRSMQRFLKLMLKMNHPVNILEVGTAVGFSAILMAQYSDPKCHITTIEKYEKRIPIAKENFRKSGFEDRITFLEGDATDILHELRINNEGGKSITDINADDSDENVRDTVCKNDGVYDFIFMDAAKAQYINFLPDVIALLKKDGVLITDNVLQDNTVIMSKFTVTRRDRTIHKRMREYLYELMNNDILTTDILKIGDGVAVSVKTGV